MSVRTTILPGAILSQGTQFITVTLFSEFLQHPPQDYFEVRQGSGHPIYIQDAQKINLLISSENMNYFPHSLGRPLTVHNREELQQLTRRLLTNPIAFDVRLQASQGNTHYTGKYMVIVWPQHPRIQPHLKRFLRQAQQAIQTTGEFYIKLDFRFALSAWFSELIVGEVIYNCCGDVKDYSVYDSGIIAIATNNTSEYLDCFGCESSTECIVHWTCFLPCCLLMAPCYNISRIATVEDYSMTFNGDTAAVAYQCLDPVHTSQDIAHTLIARMRHEAADGYNVQYVATTQPIGHQPVQFQPTTSQPSVQHSPGPSSLQIPSHTQQQQQEEGAHPVTPPPSYEDIMRMPMQTSK